MKYVTRFAALAILVIAAIVGKAQRPTTPDEAARAAAIELYQSLNEEQKKQAVLEFGDKDKYTEQFPAVTRKGIAYAKLTAAQKTKIDDVIKAMTSPYGAERCLEVAKQTGDGARYLTFFGEPAAGKAFAWRVGMHHLTLLYSEFGADSAKEFGPVLLGGNPVNKLWDEEEKIAMSLYAALTPEEAKAVQGKGNQASGSPIGKNGVKIGTLNTKAKDLARQLLTKRLEVFSADRRKVLNDMIKADGGEDELQLAIWGEITKGQADGGNYHWRIGGPTFLADWQVAGKQHLHMMVKAKA